MAESSVTLEAQGGAVLDLAFALGQPDSGRRRYDFELRAFGNLAATFSRQIEVVQPELTGSRVDLPQWSRRLLNTIRWSFRNEERIPVTAGTLSVVLEDSMGFILWQDARPYTLGAGELGSFSFEAPPLPASFLAGRLRLEATTGYGRSIRAEFLLRSDLRASVEASAPQFRAGDTGEMLLTLLNQGTLREEGQVGGSIEGIAILSTQAFSLAPGDRTNLHFLFDLPASTAGGLHRGVIGDASAPLVDFTVTVERAKLELSVEDRMYVAGEVIPVSVRNTGGSSAKVLVKLELGELPDVTENLSLDAGSAATITIPVPAHLPSGVYPISGSAFDEVAGGSKQIYRRIQVSGTEAVLSLSTDREVYPSGASMEAGARVTNGGAVLEGGLLHLEIADPCFPIDCEDASCRGSSYHIETWDGTSWAERAVRHRGAFFETDLVDLAAYLPDVEGEFKVRIRQTGAEVALLDHAALLSGGSLIAPVEATLDGFDFLVALTRVDDRGPDVADRAVMLRFPPAPAPSLVFRALEGSSRLCERTALWQRDVPLDLGPGGVGETIEAVSTGAVRGQYVFSGTVRTRDGQVLAQQEVNFEVVGGGVSVSLRTDALLYRLGTEVPVAGNVRNLSLADEPALTVFVFRVTEDFNAVLIHEESFALASGEEREYAVTTEAVSSEMLLRARVERPGQILVGTEWSFRAGAPNIVADFRLPDPLVRLVPGSPNLVEAEEVDLSAVTKIDTGSLSGTLPFPIRFGEVTYRDFRQSVDGFVELVPEGGLPTGVSSSCLDGFGSATVLAGFLGDLDPGASGFVGYKFYPAGSMDRTGRTFIDDSLVFFWDAPTKGDDPSRRNRFQILLARDGVIRIDAGTVFLPETCPRTGLALSGEVLALAPAAPFGQRLQTGVGRDPFTGRISLENRGSFPGLVSLDFGRVGGERATESLTLSPGESRTILFEDSVAEAATYSVTLAGDGSGSIQRTVSPSESLFVAYQGDDFLVPGPNLLPIRLGKSGGVGGPVSVTFTVSGPAGPQVLSRSYDLEPGILTSDAIPFDLPEGTLTLTVTAEGVPVTAEPVVLRVAPRERVAFTASAGVVSSGFLPITVDVVNIGLLNFAGAVVVEGFGGSRTTVAVSSGGSIHLELSADVAGATPGLNSFTIRLFSDSGAVVGEATFDREIQGPRVMLAESPTGLSFEAGTIASMRFVLHNTGDQAALGEFRFAVFDEERAATFFLAPGAATEIVFDLPIADDAEEKIYPGIYRLRVDRGAETTGQVNFAVKGIVLSVEASLDKDAYADGDTAQLTVEIVNSRASLGTDYLAQVHYADFEEVRPFTVAGSATLVFDIPLPRVTGEPVFLGITHPDGRSLYINTVHVRESESLVQVVVDQQVYAPGATVTVSASPTSPGTLSLSAPGYSETIALTGPVSRTFTLEPGLAGGTYQVSWSYAASDGKSASGAVPFDVAGLRVRVVEAGLDRGRYESGEILQTSLRIRTNQAASAILRASVVDPEGVASLVGESSISLTPEEDLQISSSWPFFSAVAGIHRLVFGIHQLDGGLLASGSLAFDVGAAAVLSVSTDKAHYPTAEEPVRVKVSAFVSGPSTLRLELDGETAATADVTSTGIVEIPMTLDVVSPGLHELVGLMEAQGYTSKETAGFVYGTSLPDLVAGIPLARPSPGTTWKIDVTVSNVGQSDAPATGLTIQDPATGAPVATATVPALAASASASLSVDWNVQGAAGAREIEAQSDAGNAVQEFREDNNRSRARLDVPALFLAATTARSYPANVEADLGALVTNLTPATTFTGLTVTGFLTTPDGSTFPLGLASLGPVAPGDTLTALTPWEVGRSLPGTYGFTTRLADSTGAILTTATSFFDVLPTLAFAGSVSATPNPAPAGGSLTFLGHIQNQGNVAAQGAARFELVSPEGTVAARHSALAEVPLEGSADVQVTVDSLDVAPGEYGLDLRMDVEGQEYPVAQSVLTVTGLEPVLLPDLTPRVLVYLHAPPQDAESRARRADFVGSSLRATGAIWKVTSNPSEFASLFRSGSWNTYVIFSGAPIVPPLLAEELREAVFRGDGFILVQWGPGTSMELEPALGARIAGQQPGSEQLLRILEGPLGPAQTLVVPSKAAKLKISGATVLGTVTGHGEDIPVLAVNRFGQGQTVTMGFDPAVDSDDPARAALEELFARAVIHAQPKAARAVAAGAVVPLAMVIQNPGGSVQTAEVTLSLPSEVSLASLDDNPISISPPAWEVTVPADASQSVRFQIALPDTIGVYELTSQVRVSGVLLSNSPAMSLEVTRTSETTISDVIGTLEATAVAPQEQGHLQAAVALLRVAAAIKSVPTRLELKIAQAARAARELGLIASVDLSEQRSEVDRAIAAWERAWYEWTLNGTAIPFQGSVLELMASQRPQSGRLERREDFPRHRRISAKRHGMG